MARFEVLVGLSFLNAAGEDVEGDTSLWLHIDAENEQEAEREAAEAVWVTTNVRPFTGKPNDWQGNGDEEDDDGR